MATCQALIFDLGKVVFDLSFDRVFQFWASASNKEYAELKGRFRFDGLFDDFETAAVTPAAFRREISARLGLTLTDQEFDAGWCALYLDTYRGVDELLGRLRQDHQLVALTNTNSIHSTVWKTRYASTLVYFQKVFSSHELKARKPDAPAYQAVLDYLQAKPQQTVFLDDNPDNVAGAARLGLQTVLVTSFAQMSAELRALGLPA